MHDDPSNSSFSTPVFRAAWMMLVSIARLSYRNSAGRVALARMPPTVAAARNTACGRAFSIHASTSACRRKSTSARRDRQDLAVLVAQAAHDGRARHATMTGHPDAFACEAVRDRSGHLIARGERQHGWKAVILRHNGSSMLRAGAEPVHEPIPSTPFTPRTWERRSLTHSPFHGARGAVCSSLARERYRAAACHGFTLENKIVQRDSIGYHPPETLV